MPVIPAPTTPKTTATETAYALMRTTARTPTIRINWIQTVTESAMPATRTHRAVAMMTTMVGVAEAVVEAAAILTV